MAEFDLDLDELEGLSDLSDFGEEDIEDSKDFEDFEFEALFNQDSKLSQNHPETPVTLFRSRSSPATSKPSTELTFASSSSSSSTSTSLANIPFKKPMNPPKTAASTSLKITSANGKTGTKRNLDPLFLDQDDDFQAAPMPKKRQSSLLEFLSGGKERLEMEKGKEAQREKENEEKGGKLKGRGKKGAEKQGKKFQLDGKVLSNSSDPPKPKYCPFYKKILGTAFSVDAFSYGPLPNITEYFLSHFHSDHYQGLSKKFNYGIIYCSPITARLVVQQLGVDPNYVVSLDLNVTYDINGVRVSFIDANHCPGAVLILFELPNGRVYLHTGDFRACDTMATHALLKNLRIDALYLDTTYCKPTYTFPPQNVVINHVITKVREALTKDPSTIILVGSYSIGKERVFMAIAEEFKMKICITKQKYEVVQCLDFPNWKETFTTDFSESNLHVVNIGILNVKQLAEYHKEFPKNRSIIAIKPTGWTYDQDALAPFDQAPPVKSTNGKIAIYGVPYSEHSSFDELKRFVSKVRPARIFATVGANSKKARDTFQGYFNSWLSS